MRHPLHPALVHFPVACWTLATLADATALVWEPGWRWPFAFALTALGCGFGLIAAAAGLYELLRLPSNHPATRTAMLHMTLALTSWCLYAGSLLLRVDHRQPVPPGALALLLGAVGLLTLLATGWLGGKLVYGYGVGIARQDSD